MRPADAALVGELEDALGARVERLVHRVAEAGRLAAARADRRRGGVGDRRRVAARGHLAPAPPRAAARTPRRCRGCTGPAAEDPRRHGALQRARVGGERHPRGDVRGHHPVLGDRHQQQVEEVALVLGRLLAGQQQVEVLGEAQPAHEVAGEVAAPHLDAVGVGLADVGDGGAALSEHRGDAMSRTRRCCFPQEWDHTRSGRFICSDPRKGSPCACAPSCRPGVASSSASLCCSRWLRPARTRPPRRATIRPTRPRARPARPTCARSLGRRRQLGHAHGRASRTARSAAASARTSASTS